MLGEIAYTVTALLISPSGSENGLSLGKDKELQTSARLIETEDSITFEITGPNTVASTISVDVNRNGSVDRDRDFAASIEPGGAPCLSYLITETSSTTCNAPGQMVKIQQSRLGPWTATTFRFPKKEVSGDGFGFGFAIELWSMTGRFQNLLASGDYRFGGKLSLVDDGPNFKGDRKSGSSAFLAAMRGYQGCVNKAMEELEPLDHSVVKQIRALPVTCAAARSTAQEQGIKALIADGISQDEATLMTRGSLDEYDADIGRMADRLEKTR
jgi:hypothetical protein